MLSLIRTHQHSLACIGEIGLDYSPHILGKTEAEQEATKQIQRDCMRAQVELAQELGLAVNVHSRSAGHHALTLLRECASVAGQGPVRAILHAFDGKAHYAEEAAMWGIEKKAKARAREGEGENSTKTGSEASSEKEANIEIYFSVPPCAKRSPLMQKWIKRIPLSRLLLETDCPALAPEKGEINVPANLAVSAALVAELKSVTVEEVVTVTNQNAEGLLKRRTIE
jgi:TatD DNase family protein